MAEEKDTVAGTIEAIVYVHPENGFTVARLREDKKRELISVVGHFASLQPGETVVCQGSWGTHPSFGKQFSVTECQIEIPSDLVGIQKYLESGLVKGIGPVFAKKIVDRFGLNTLTVIDETPRRLLEIPGVGVKKMDRIVSCWEQQREIRKVMVFLRAHGVSPAYAQKIFKAYGNESIARVRENPYGLAKDIFGIGFKMADTIARNLGLPLQSAQRIAAGIQFVLWDLATEGHTCYPQQELIAAAQKMLEVEEPLVAQELERLVEREELVREDQIIWLRPFRVYEEGIARDLGRLRNHPQALRAVDVDKAIEWVQRLLHIRFAKQQEEALKQALSHKLHIITGGPGTGKSTITNGLLAILSKITNQILLAAPTGRAAKRLSEITRKKAFTLHALLEWDPISGGFKRGRENPLSCELLIIDEVSMIDTQLMFHLLRAIPSGARVLFVGDIDQLPSVGAGTVLRDLIDSQFLAVTTLTEIFRQAKGSQIITNAHRINRGEFPDLSSRGDFHFVEAETPEEIQREILDLISQKIPREYGFDPIQEIQLLSPMKKGLIGIEQMNSALQEKLNPSSRPFFKGGQRLHLFDKVMQMRNNYQKKVMNGDIGRIEKIDPEEQQLIVSFDDLEVVYEFSELDELQLSYAISVHKYQGSECPCIVMPMHTSHFKLLQRNLFYTAVTRGKKQVFLVGTQKAIAIAIQNNEVSRRTTGLVRAIKNLSFGLVKT
jgi:exodeoxyribonuclease V alpha subunit